MEPIEKVHFSVAIVNFDIIMHFTSAKVQEKCFV